MDYDAGNLRSVANMLTFLNIPFVITSNKNEILSAKKIIFPGQGHFAQAMSNLERKGLVPVINVSVPSSKVLPLFKLSSIVSPAPGLTCDTSTLNLPLNTYPE